MFRLWECLDDCKKLWRDHRVSVRNCIDLALLARSVDVRWKGPYKGSIGLSRLVAIYLERYLPKGGVQTSNWEMELSSEQQECKFLKCPAPPRVPEKDITFFRYFSRCGE